MENQKDKIKIILTDLLKSNREGLTIAEIMKRTKLARHTVLARLHELIGEGNIEVRQVNMAKLHFWKGAEEVPAASGVQLNPITEGNIKKISVMKKEKPVKFDIKKIKAEIEAELNQGTMKKHEAQIQEQRMPVTHIITNSKHLSKSFPTKYILTGIEGLDELFDEGIPKGSSVLVAGGAGAGKTILGLQMLHNHALKGEKCLYMSFEESEERLIHHMDDFGWNPEELMKKKNIVIKRFNPFDITRSVDALLMKAKGELLIDIDPIILPKEFKPDIIVVDSLTAIASAFTGKEESYRIYIEQLFRFFEKIGATSFLITETKEIPTVFSQTGVEEFLADGVIVLYNIKRGNVRENAIEILKLRGASHKKKIVAFQITHQGIVVYPNQEIIGEIKEE